MVAVDDFVAWSAWIVLSVALSAAGLRFIRPARCRFWRAVLSRGAFFAGWLSYIGYVYWLSPTARALEVWPVVSFTLIVVGLLAFRSE